MQTYNAIRTDAAHDEEKMDLDCVILGPKENGGLTLQTFSCFIVVHDNLRVFDKVPLALSFHVAKGMSLLRFP